MAQSEPLKSLGSSGWGPAGGVRWLRNASTTDKEFGWSAGSGWLSEVEEGNSLKLSATAEGVGSVFTGVEAAATSINGGDVNAAECPCGTWF